MLLTCGSDWTPMLSAHRALGGWGWAQTPTPCWPIQLCGCSCCHIRRPGRQKEGRPPVWRKATTVGHAVPTLTWSKITHGLDLHNSPLREYDSFLVNTFPQWPRVWPQQRTVNSGSGNGDTVDLSSTLPAPKWYVAGPAVSSCWPDYSLPIQPNHFWIFVSVTAMKLPLTQSSGRVTLRELREGAPKRSSSRSWSQAG